MAELKTQPNSASVSAFINAIDDPQKRKDCKELVQLMKRITGERPRMWGDAIVGFGTYHYKYASGREADWMQVGFSPRKQALTMYIMAGFSRYDEILKKLGKFGHGKSCLYVKKLDDIDRKQLERLVTESVKHVSKNQGK